jgi:hypothetical protein
MGSESRAISALNDCIQERFKEINDRFGVARIVKIGETPHRFQPESVAEMSSVRALEQARLQLEPHGTSRPRLWSGVPGVSQA